MVRQPIHLKRLAEAHSAEIDRMTEAMLRADGGALWTAEMPAVTRGGKCMVISAEDEPDSPI
jgi:hypothetical protein